MYSCVMFDLDGTLCDTLADLAGAANFALGRFGFPQHPVESYKLMVGNGLTRLMERALPPDRVCPDTVAALRSTMLEYYRAHLLDHTRPYPGMEALIRRLRERGIALYVVTNKPQEQSSTIVESLFPGMFSGIAGQQEGRPTKPDPWGVELFLEHSGLPREACLFVGDSSVDAATAAAAGLACAGVTWGFRTREELTGAGARFTADTAVELEAIIMDKED